jgi:hypothetical protein
MAFRRQGMAVLLVALAAWGCSKGNDPPPAENNTSNSSTPAAANPAGSGEPGGTVAQIEPPAAIVTRFLDALRRGEKETVATLLTSAARAETVRLGYEINPPGDPTSQYQVGRVETVPGPPEEAYVSSLWTHDLGNGEVFSYEAVWIVRREPEGWRISGLAVSEPESEAPLVFNFEKLDEVFEKKSQAEAEPAGEAARQAQNPGAGGNTVLPLE